MTMKVSFSNTDEEAKTLKATSRWRSQFIWKLAINQDSGHSLARRWFNYESIVLSSLLCVPFVNRSCSLSHGHQQETVLKWGDQLSGKILQLPGETHELEGSFHLIAIKIFPFLKTQDISDCTYWHVSTESWLCHCGEHVSLLKFSRGATGLQRKGILLWCERIDSGFTVALRLEKIPFGVYSMLNYINNSQCLLQQRRLLGQSCKCSQYLHMFVNQWLLIVHMTQEPEV